MKRPIPFESILLQWVAASPNNGRIFYEDPLLVLNKA
jgi:hypothetical protein